jgi:multiple sugar transport system permease protein
MQACAGSGEGTVVGRILNVQAISRHLQWGKLETREAIAFHLFAAPWIIGFLVFTAYPTVASFFLSFTHYEVITPAQWIGLGNYLFILHDPLFWQSLKVTAIYAIGSVSLGVTFAFLLALLMNQPIPGISIYRTLYYLPSTISGVPVALLWMWVFDPAFGVLNNILALFGIQGPQWLFSTTWVLPAFIIMSLWGVGGAMVIYLAGLQGIPRQLYEAAELDGATVFVKFRFITIPMVSPVIFFNLIMSIIGSFQTFTTAYVMTGGGPANASLFYALYLYQNAFQFFKMGYASALAWVLLIIVLALSLVVIQSSPYWVYYEGRLRG